MSYIYSNCSLFLKSSKGDESARKFFFYYILKKDGNIKFEKSFKIDMPSAAYSKTFFSDVCNLKCELRCISCNLFRPFLTKDKFVNLPKRAS